MTALDRKALRHAGLSAFDIKTIKNLVERGGETGWYPHAGNKPEWLFVAVQSMVDRDIVVIVERPLQGMFMRLTDFGRFLAGQLEAMDIKPQIIVNSTGETA